LRRFFSDDALARHTSFIRERRGALGEESVEWRAMRLYSSP
jgi:hypothetical protein